MTLPLVLDAEGLSSVASARPPDGVRALLREAHRRDRDVIVPAVVCAEICRGAARTRQVEVALGRRGGRDDDRPAVAIVVGDLAVAKGVGAILHASDAGSEDLADAHVVQACVSAGGGLVVTADPDDIRRLAEAVPGIRIVTRSP
ncbi:MAG: type II toxin-antitoxin system VapC family toxin [Euzebya sp.]